MTDATGYRRDIDGLRAVAVLPVVFSHGGIPGFSGGFIGVDIFFVISGFLITGILIREIEAGRFSLLNFYERRARRILPALFALLAVWLGLGYVLLPPAAYEALASGAAATVLFASNIWFWEATGTYFGTAAEFEPLLHTWSLAVEEQFYIVIPLLLWALAPRGRRAVAGAIAALTLASLALSVWATNAAPLFNFFLTPTRAWELGIGAWLALALSRGGTAGTRPNGAILESVAALGLAAIGASILLLDETHPFPGLTALPACLGTAAIIWAGGHGETRTGRLLSTPPFVGIGLISYSLYLWHWPPLVVARIIEGSPHIDLGLALAISALSVLLAWLSWRFVERPFRSRTGHQRFGRAAIFGMSGASALAIGLAALAIIRSDGVWIRLPDATRTTYLEAQGQSELERACRRAMRQQGHCLLGNDTTPGPQVLIWGDSHAAAMLPGFELWLEKTGQSALARIKNGCAPLLGLNRRDLGAAHDCAGFNADTLTLLETTPSIETVILAGRWAMMADGTRAPGEAGNPPRLVLAPGARGPESGAAGTLALFALGLDSTLRNTAAPNRRILVIDSVPEIGFDVPEAYITARFFGTPIPDVPTRADYEARNRQATAVFSDLATRHRFERRNIAEMLCTSRCAIEAEGTLLYRDDDHLSTRGARMLLPDLLR